MEYTLQVAGIAGTLGLLWLTLSAMRKFRGAETPKGRVQVQQRIALANGCQLVVVEWNGQELLLATGSQPCTVVATKPAVVAPVEARGAWAQ